MRNVSRETPNYWTGLQILQCSLYELSALLPLPSTHPAAMQHRVKDYLLSQLASLEEQGLLRSPQRPPSSCVIDATSNDYLGLAQDVGLAADLCLASPLGSGASRLIYGSHPEHEGLEAEVASWVALPAGLLFSSGYAANVGTISSLASRGHLVISDELNHASIIDGCRLSGARVVVTPHLDLAAVQHALETARELRRWVVTESYFSMDGDSPNLTALRDLCDRFQAGLIVDEAHAVGILGPRGAGMCNEAGIKPEAMIVTLGKALGTAGAVVAGSGLLRTWLWNRARSFVFSTAPSPRLAAWALQSVRRAQAADQARQWIARQACELRDKLVAGGLNLAPRSHGPIIPILLGQSSRAMLVADNLQSAGIKALAIRPPTVPHGTDRLRVTLNAAMSDSDVARLGDALIEHCATATT